MLKKRKILKANLSPAIKGHLYVFINNREEEKNSTVPSVIVLKWIWRDLKILLEQSLAYQSNRSTSTPSGHSSAI